MTTLSEFQWFFELGYVTIIATILSMLLTNVWKLTILKKFLANTTSSDEKDKVLGLVGSITSIVVYGIVYVANIIILQKTIFIQIEWDTAWIAITTGSSVTWVAAKGLYTVIHKFINRINNKKSAAEIVVETKKDLGELEKLVKEEQNADTPSVIETVKSYTRRRR